MDHQTAGIVLVTFCSDDYLAVGSASYLLQQLLHLLPVLLLTVVDDVVPPPTLSNQPSQPWVFFLQVFL